MEKVEYIKSLVNLLNGQLRGTINNKAKSENESLIYLTLNSIFDFAFSEGIKEGVNITKSEILKDEIAEKVKVDIKNIRDPYPYPEGV